MIFAFHYQDNILSVYGVQISYAFGPYGYFQESCMGYMAMARVRAKAMAYYGHNNSSDYG